MNKGIDILVAVERNKIPIGQKHKLHLLIKVRGISNGQQQRRPLNLGFVLDRSGSMEGGKLDYTRQAVELCMTHLDEKDIQSIVIFDHEVEMLMAPTKLVNKDMAKKVLQKVWARGTTNLSAGLIMGGNLVGHNSSDERINRVLVLTDGQANQGITSADGLATIAGKIGDRGIGVTCLGVGEDFDEEVLIGISEAGRGNFYYIENPDQIPSIFEQELEGLLQVLAQKLEINIDSPYLTKAYGYIPEVTEKGFNFALPDLYSGEEKVLILEMELPAMQSGTQKLVNIKVSYFDTFSMQEQIVEVPVDIFAGDIEQIGDADANPEVEKHLRRLRMAEAQNEALSKADEGDFDSARELLKEVVAEMLPMMADEDELTELDQLQESIKYYSDEQYNQSTRKKIRAASYRQQKNRPR